MNGFEDLEVWKKCRQLRVEISALLKGFQDQEKYRLIDQLKRASMSVTANIAEGHGRFHYLDNLKFCRNARGSLNEILDHLKYVFTTKRSLAPINFNISGKNMPNVSG